MTCIVGLIANNRVYIGGDSAGVGGTDLTIRKDSKVFKNGPFLFGFTTSFRMGQLLRYKLEVPEREPDQDIHEYMCTTFVDALRECFKENGYMKIDSNVEDGGNFLVGYEGRLFQVWGDLQVGESVDNYMACGSGENVALGAMFVLDLNRDLEPVAKVRMALEAADHLNTGVCPPFTIDYIEKSETDGRTTDDKSEE